MTIRNLAKRFHLPLDDLLASEAPSASDTYRFFGGYYPPASVLADFAPVFAAVTADANAAGYPTTYRRSNKAGRCSIA